jgi:hypothetical protein
MSHVRSVSSLFAVLHTAAFSYGPLTHSGQLEQQREQTVSEPTGLDAEREQGPGTVSRSKRAWMAGDAVEAISMWISLCLWPEIQSELFWWLFL